jgi:hypothetical protein
MNLNTLGTLRSRAGAVNSIAALMRDLIDYAGLFPPASLNMASAVAKYDEYLRSEWEWILGRFIVPVARLDEFKEALAGLQTVKPRNGFRNWRLSGLLGPEVVDDMARVRAFNARKADSRSARRSIIESLEMKVSTPEEIKQVSGIVPAGVKVYFELPLSARAECIAMIANCGRLAKIRTGGETIDKFPASENVVEFIRLCAAAKVPFKATAGLHHPVRSVHRLTYQPDSPSGIMHGFINVFLAACFVRSGMDARLAVELLGDQSSKAFVFDEDHVDWRGHQLSLREISAARKSFAVSFGACSFTEPIDDLRSLNLL